MLLHDTHKLPRSKRTSWIRQEIDGTWKQYFGPKNLRIFLVFYSQIRVLSGGKRLEVTGKIQRFSGPEYCFRFPSIFAAFPSETVIFPHVPDQFKLFPEAGVFDLDLSHNQYSVSSTHTIIVCPKQLVYDAASLYMIKTVSV